MGHEIYSLPVGSYRIEEQPWDNRRVTRAYLQNYNSLDDDEKLFSDPDGSLLGVGHPLINFEAARSNLRKSLENASHEIDVNADITPLPYAIVINMGTNQTVFPVGIETSTYENKVAACVANDKVEDDDEDFDELENILGIVNTIIRNEGLFEYSLVVQEL